MTICSFNRYLFKGVILILLAILCSFFYCCYLEKRKFTGSHNVAVGQKPTKSIFKTGPEDYFLPPPNETLDISEIKEHVIAMENPKTPASLGEERNDDPVVCNPSLFPSTTLYTPDAIPASRSAGVSTARLYSSSAENQVGRHLSGYCTSKPSSAKELESSESTK